MSENNLFKELNKLKEEVADKLLSNQNILKLLRYDSDNPLGEPDIDNPQELLDSYIYLKPRAYDTQWSTRSVLITRIVAKRVRGSKTYADIALVFTIVVHNQICLLEDGRDRMFCICDELHKSFHDEASFGIGKIEFEDFREVNGSSDYYSNDIVFKVTVFNK